MKHPTQITLLLISMFLLAQLFGLLVFSRYMDSNTKLPSKDTPIGQIQTSDVKETNWEFIIILISAILIGTGICLFLIRNQNFNMLKIWIGIALCINLMVSIGAFVNAIVAFFFASGLTLWRIKKGCHKLILHNITEIMLYGGFATLFAFVLNIWGIILLLIAISIYDIFAVWKSKHMVKMAKGLMKANIFAGLLVNYKGKKAVLGGGDIAFPLLASVVMLRNYNWVSALFTIAGSTIALTLLLFLGRKGKFYPAMPFLSAGIFSGMIGWWLI